MIIFVEIIVVEVFVFNKKLLDFFFKVVVKVNVVLLFKNLRGIVVILVIFGCGKLRFFSCIIVLVDICGVVVI